MKKQWEKMLSVLLCVLLVGALVPPVAAATVAGEIGKVVLEPGKESFFEGYGEGLAVKEPAKRGYNATFYSVGSDGSAQKGETFGLYYGGGRYPDGSDLNGNFVVDGNAGEIVWRETAGKTFKESGDGYVVYEVGSETFELYDFATGERYTFPSSLWTDFGHYGEYGEGKFVLLDKSSQKYFYYDLATGQNAFPGKEFEVAGAFSEGYAVTCPVDGREQQIIDSSGQVTFANVEDYWIVSEKEEGLFVADGEGGYGYIDHTGAMVIPVPYKYDITSGFHNNYASFRYVNVTDDVYADGLIERSTGEFIELNMNILTAVSSAGTLWVSTLDDPNTAYLVKVADLIADRENGPTRLSAVKYVPYSQQLMDWKAGAAASGLEGLPSGMELKEGVLSGVPTQTGEYSFSFSVDGQVHSYILTVAENVDTAVDASVSNGYEIEAAIPDTITGEEDQLFVIEDAETAVDVGSNFERFLDVYLDGVKLVGGKVSDPQQAESGWDYYAQEGSTKITIFAQTFRKVPDGSHTISATFKALDGNANKIDTVSQNFKIGRTTPSTPSDPGVPGVPSIPVGTLNVGDTVNFTGTTHYYASNYVKGKACRPGLARITQIYNGKHPYHLIAVPGSGSNVYGWVDTADIEGAGGIGSAQQSGGIAKGAVVTVKEGARTYTGGSLAGFVYKTTYTVIQVKGDRAVIGLNGVATAAMNVNDLVLAN